MPIDLNNNLNARSDARPPREMRLEDVTPDMALPRNIFANMGLPNADMRQAKALVSILFEKSLKRQGLTQRQAAQRTGLTQPEVSKIVRGVCSGFTLDRLLSAMAALGHDVEIGFEKAAPDQERGTVRVGSVEAALSPPAALGTSAVGGVEIAEVDAANPPAASARGRARATRSGERIGRIGKARVHRLDEVVPVLRHAQAVEESLHREAHEEPL